MYHYQFISYELAVVVTGSHLSFHKHCSKYWYDTKSCSGPLTVHDLSSVVPS